MAMRVGVSLPVRELAGDLVAIRDFAQAAEGMGLTHLRVPDQVMRPNSGHLHEPLSLLNYIAAITEKIELCPSVLVLPLRPAALVARQTAALDVLSGGRLRLGIGVGASAPEFQALGVDFHQRGKICDEQLEVIHQLWQNDSVSFAGRFHNFENNGIDPRPVQQPIPIWIGGRSIPSDAVVERIGRWADGWFVLAGPEDYPAVRARVDAAAERHGRAADAIGTEAGVAVVGPREAEWQARVQNWHDTGLTHLCLRTLGGGLEVGQHLPKLSEVVAELPVENVRSE